MRPCIVPPADVHTHLLHRNLLQCSVQGLHVASRHVQELRLARAMAETWFSMVQHGSAWFSLSFQNISNLFIPFHPLYIIYIPKVSSGRPESGGRTAWNLLNRSESGPQISMASLRCDHLVWRPMPKSGQSTCHSSKSKPYGCLGNPRSKHIPKLGTCRSRPCLAIC